MSISQEHLIELNTGQKISESDPKTSLRYHQLFSHLPPKAIDVLDVGCNTGRGGAVLKTLKPSLKLAGLDCIQDRIDRADSKIYDSAICSFANDIPLSEKTFDAVVAVQMIEHVSPTEVDACLAEFFRVLRLKGRLILTTPNPSYLKNRLQNLSVMMEPSHVTQHHASCLRDRLRKIGFSNVRIYGNGKVAHYIGQRVPFLPIYGSFLIRGDKW